MDKNMDDMDLESNDSASPLCERFPEYDGCGRIYWNDLLWVSKDNLKGIADSNGNLLTPIKWRVLSVRDNHLLLEAEDQTYMMDSLGNLTVTDERID